MTEWGVFGVLAALLAFILSIIKPIVNLTQSITKLATVVDQLQKDYEEQRRNSEESHKRIWTTVNEHTHQLSDHETRIHDLERDNQ
jgi:Mg2+/Co2+ transporter CorB